MLKLLSLFPKLIISLTFLSSSIKIIALTAPTVDESSILKLSTPAITYGKIRFRISNLAL